MKLEKLLEKKSFNELIITDKQLYQLQKVLDWLPKQNLVQKQSVISILPKMVQSGVDDLYIRRLIWNKKHAPKGGYTLFKCLILYGRKGYEYWDSYKERQAFTNTLEYKKNKYGWSEHEFKEYNKSRSVTIENCILKHGEERGNQIWENYRKRQAFTNTLEYYIEKFDGDKEKGKEEFSKYNKSKAITFDNLMNKYDNEEKVLKMLEGFYNKTSHYSNISQKLFNKIYGKLSQELQEKTYYGTLNKEFGKYDDISKKYFMFDFIISNIKYCIEFNGDHYHANPLIYKPDEIPCVYPKEDKYISKKLWERDKLKREVLTKQGFEYIVIWEKDFNNDEDLIVKKCVEGINERHKLFRQF